MKDKIHQKKPYNIGVKMNRNVIWVRQKVSLSFFVFLLLTVMCFGLSCRNQKAISKVTRPESTYCKMLDTLVCEYFLWKGNAHSNDIIPILEKESGIDASCRKGTLGHSYDDDSTFLSDLDKWKKYFKCNHKSTLD